MLRKHLTDHCVGSNDAFRLAVGLRFCFAFQTLLLIEKGMLWGCAFFYVLHTKSAKRVRDQKTSAFSHTHLLSGTICWEGIKNLETTTKNQTKNKESKIPKNPKIQKIQEIQKIQKSKKSKNPKNTHIYS